MSPGLNSTLGSTAPVFAAVPSAPLGMPDVLLAFGSPKYENRTFEGPLFSGPPGVLRFLKNQESR